ncbi:MAG: HTH domain-containing protein [Pseudomonadota bacterium]
MRAARLLQILLLLQNRGRLTSTDLSRELEVSRRTILRDVDALTEAGLPIIVYQGNQGGIELGFNYRTRLTAFDAQEAEALGVILNARLGVLHDLGMAQAAARARSKLIESFTDVIRARVADAADQFDIAHDTPASDPRIAALAEAVRGRRIVLLKARSTCPVECHPVKLIFDSGDWALQSALEPTDLIKRTEWGDINISRRSFPT